jgi:hypothetical protein
MSIINNKNIERGIIRMAYRKNKKITDTALIVMSIDIFYE